MNHTLVLVNGFIYACKWPCIFSAIGKNSAITFKVGQFYKIRIPLNTIRFFETAGLMSALLLALFLNHDWRALKMAYSVPAAAFLAYWWWAPESIRWLISKVCTGVCCVKSYVSKRTHQWVRLRESGYVSLSAKRTNPQNSKRNFSHNRPLVFPSYKTRKQKQQIFDSGRRKLN